MSESDDKYIQEKKTYRLQMGNFRAFGNWSCTNSFDFVITHFLNGHPQGHLTGTLTGKNLGYCRVCGTAIVHHFTVHNDKEGDYNVGCECLDKIISEKDAEVIKKTVQSIQRQIKADITRPIKIEQMKIWLEANYEKLHDLRNSRINAELKEEPMRYWALTTADWNHELKKFNPTRYKTEQEINNEYYDLKKGAMYLEKRNRDFWVYIHNNFGGWSPDTMKKVYIEECKTENIEMDFKWRKLTDEENEKISEMTIQKINEYFAKLKKVSA